jgi:hypothetical protein
MREPVVVLVSTIAIFAVPAPLLHRHILVAFLALLCTGLVENGVDDLPVACTLRVFPLAHVFQILLDNAFKRHSCCWSSVLEDRRVVGESLHVCALNGAERVSGL